MGLSPRSVKAYCQSGRPGGGIQRDKAGELRGRKGLKFPTKVQVQQAEVLCEGAGDKVPAVGAVGEPHLCRPGSLPACSKLRGCLIKLENEDRGRVLISQTLAEDESHPAVAAAGVQLQARAAKVPLWAAAQTVGGAAALPRGGSAFQLFVVAVKVSC